VDGYLAQVLQRRHNHETFAFYRVNVLERPDVAERFKMHEWPALVVVDDNGRYRRLERPKGPEDVRRFLAPWLR
jgi:hypothetical protein